MNPSQRRPEEGVNACCGENVFFATKSLERLFQEPAITAGKGVNSEADSEERTESQ